MRLEGLNKPMKQSQRRYVNATSRFDTEVTSRVLLGKHLLPLELLPTFPYQVTEKFKPDFFKDV